MRVAAFLWIAIFGVLQVPSNKDSAKNHSAVTSQTSAAADTQQKSTGAADQRVPVPSQRIDSPSAAAKTEQSRDDVEIQRQLAKYTKNLVWVGIAQAVVLAGTLVVIWRQAKLMKTHAEHLKSLADAAEGNTIAAGDQFKAMQEQIGQMQEAGRQTDQLIVAAQKSADAAKISADIAARVAIPTLVVEKFETGQIGAGSLTAFFQYPKVNIVIKNCGQTPAFLKWWTIIFSIGDLPDTPVYTGKPGCGIALEKVLIEPDASYTLPELGFPQRQEFKMEDVQAALYGEEFTAYGYICYGDLFGSPLKRLKFCETALNRFETWPFLQWVDLGYDEYTGSDQFPVRKPTSGQGIEGQPSRSDTKTHDRPENTD